MCEGYTELAPLVAIFRINMSVENKSRRLTQHFIMLKACSQRCSNLQPKLYVVLCCALNMSSGGCGNCPNCFCCICGQSVVNIVTET
jgi:hypothetical protein